MLKSAIPFDAAVLLASFLIVLPVGAEPANPTSDEPPRSKLQGAVKGTQIGMSEYLKELGDNCHHIESALKTIYYEVQKQDIVAVGGPNVVGAVVLPALPSGTGFLSMDGPPPRKKWLNFGNKQILELVSIIVNETDSLMVDSNASSELSAELAYLKEDIVHLQAEREALAQACVGPDFDKRKIVELATIVDARTKELERHRKQIQRLLKKD